MRIFRRSDLRFLVFISLVFASAQIGLRAEKIITVNTNGEGGFKTIQAAVDSIPNHNTNACVIQIAPGRYAESVVVPSEKPYITLRGSGQSREEVVIANEKEELHVKADDFRAENLTLENTVGPNGPFFASLFCEGQRLAFQNLLIKAGPYVSLSSWKGSLDYFTNCEIWSGTDAVRGGGTAVFDHCNIVETHETPGHVIASTSTPEEVKYGLVFLNCRLTKSPGVRPESMRLGHPEEKGGQSAFINCLMEDHINPKGWSDSDSHGQKVSSRAVEYGSKTLDGTAIDVSRRAPSVKILTDSEAAEYSVTNILNGWNPSEPW